MSVRFGASPIAWANDDMPELGAETTVGTILAEAAAIGFEGVELGGRFPRAPAQLGALLAPHRLDLIGGWWSTHLLTRSADDEVAALQPHLALLKAMGSPVFIAAECSNAIHGQRGVPLSQTPRLAAAEWPRFGERLSTLAAYVEAQGLRFAYHFHLGTVVERQEDLDQFLAHTTENVGLVVDTGHAALGGVDAVTLIRSHPTRVAHVHSKSVRRGVFEALRGGDGSFLEGVLAGMFTAPGDGDVDFALVMGALAEIDFRGWIVVEAEQDPKLANPVVYGRLGLTTLKAAAAAAGLIVATPAKETAP
jgi:inosose dehydratase